ncbi:MAG: hypothetical protein WBO07_06855 [Formosimonas sp.]
MRNAIRWLTAGLAAALLCSACGYRGALYFPNDAPPVNTSPVIAPTQ